MIHVRNLTKRFNGHAVLRHVSLDVAKGEVSVLIGPSGCGKSTLLRCLNGLEHFDEGNVRVAGHELEPGPHGAERQPLLHALRRRVGMVFQQFNLFPHMSALENVMAGPVHAFGVPRETAEPRARALLERVGLGDRLFHRPSMLAGGQQQRVAIARALANDPELILFDEPTSALDPQMTAEVLAVMSDLASDGQTMVVVSHAMGFVRRSAHRVHVLADGGVIESGRPEEVFASPREERTRRFLEQAHL